MNIIVFWEKTADTFKTQPEVLRARSAARLRSRWSVLQRVVQKYLSADKQYRRSIPSGEVEEDTVASVMKLYCGISQMASKSGEKVDAPDFQSVEAALLLATAKGFLQNSGGRPAPTWGTDRSRWRRAGTVAVPVVPARGLSGTWTATILKRTTTATTKARGPRWPQPCPHKAQARADRWAPSARKC